MNPYPQQSLPLSFANEERIELSTCSKHNNPNMEVLSVTLSIAKEFANIVLSTLIKDQGWNAVNALCVNGTYENERTIKGNGWKLSNLFYVTSKAVTEEYLIKNDRTRYNKIPIYQSKGIFCYLSTQWVTDSNNHLNTLDLKTFIETYFSDFYEIKIIQSGKHKSNRDFTFTQKIVQFDRHSSVSPKKQSQPLLPPTLPPRQRILYGCPGTGKSTQVKKEAAGMQTFRTTFHPEQDYYSFVGGFRPTMEGEGEGRKIAYSFVPQVFMKAYISAWRNPDVAHCLIIEEINRGNCAAIFGDLFQLLDRANDGFSEYAVQAETEQRKYLAQALADSEYENTLNAVYASRNEAQLNDAFSVLLLPNNLSLLATMNTSDQSLYPMDSAFKRRWDWECCPIDYEKAAEFAVAIGKSTYNWRSFLQAVNQKVYALTQSEDKQVGTFFVKPQNNRISETDFVNKVLFYLWTDVLKDENPSGEHFFSNKTTNRLRLMTFLIKPNKRNA